MLFGSTSFETFFGAIGLKETKNLFSGKDIDFSSFMDMSLGVGLKISFVTIPFNCSVLFFPPLFIFHCYYEIFPIKKNSSAYPIPKP